MDHGGGVGFGKLAFVKIGRAILSSNSRCTHTIFGNKSFQLLSFILGPGYTKMENYWDFNYDCIAPIYRTSEEYKALAELLATYPTSKYSMWYGHFPPYFV